MTSPTTVGVAKTHPPVLYSHNTFGNLCAGGFFTGSCATTKSAAMTVTARDTNWGPAGLMDTSCRRSVLTLSSSRHVEAHRGHQHRSLDDVLRSEERRVGKECRSRWS